VSASGGRQRQIASLAATFGAYQVLWLLLRLWRVPLYRFFRRLCWTRLESMLILASVVADPAWTRLSRTVDPFGADPREQARTAVSEDWPSNPGGAEEIGPTSSTKRRCRRRVIHEPSIVRDRDMPT